MLMSQDWELAWYSEKKLLYEVILATNIQIFWVFKFEERYGINFINVNCHDSFDHVTQ